LEVASVTPTKREATQRRRLATGWKLDLIRRLADALGGIPLPNLIRLHLQPSTSVIDVHHVHVIFLDINTAIFIAGRLGPVHNIIFIVFPVFILSLFA
jgi:hypothetical protein